RREGTPKAAVRSSPDNDEGSTTRDRRLAARSEGYGFPAERPLAVSAASSKGWIVKRSETRNPFTGVAGYVASQPTIPQETPRSPRISQNAGARRERDVTGMVLPRSSDSTK